MSRDLRAALLAGAATVMTLLVLAPLLADRTWLQPVVLVVAAVSLAAAGVALAGLPRWTAVPATLLAALVITTALLVPSQAALGGFLPTRRSVEALGLLVARGVETSQVVVAPAPVDGPVVALLTVAAALVAVATVLVAGPLRRPGAAGLPLLLVVCVATALSPGGIGLLGYLSAAAGYLAMALTDADRRLAAWGQVLGRRGAGGTAVPSGVTEHLVRVAAVTAAVAVGVGALVPALVPGASADRLQQVVDERFGEGGGGATAVNPFLDIREDLEEQDDTVVIRYATTDDDPDPLRIVTADTFDGAVWGPSPVAPSADQAVSGGLPSPPGATAEVLGAADRVSTSLSVGGLAQTFLPLPYPPAQVDVEGTWLYDPRTLNVLSTTGTTEGLAYSVTSYDISPDAAQLATATTAGTDPTWTTLPEGVSEVVVGEAERVTADETSPYGQALALQQWFRNFGGFTYSLDAPTTTDRDAVEAFLEDRRGYCVQFASTMALMSRSLGIPARVAVGFLPGEEVEPGQWEIRADDAHAWPELYFDGVGWVRFEPTPAGRTGAPPSWAVPESDPAVPDAATPSAPAALPEQLGPDESAAQQPGAEAGRDLWDRVRGLAADAAVLLLVLLAVGLLLAVPRGWRALRAWRRRREADGDAARLAVVAWTELLERLADLDALPSGATAREQAARLRSTQRIDGDDPADGEALASLSRLVEAWERALYAPEPAPADGLDDDVAAVLAAVRNRLPRRARWSATWFPTPSPDLAATAGTAGSTGSGRPTVGV
ncbi:transglutaminaseTgpA domain-containing protein [Aquipuribacter nitratireducens]|uniref:TransglutaminaseTgpA domain-containing protein n=1 Tax=Aquipuribacter nitratireducens TaxID=650104 RepID=A0ABW0GQI2_9MICO